MAVTLCFPSIISSTVMQTQLWATLWSILSSSEMGDFIQKLILFSEEMISVTIPIFSMIPVNMQQIYFFYYLDFEI